MTEGLAMFAWFTVVMMGLSALEFMNKWISHRAPQGRITAAYIAVISSLTFPYLAFVVVLLT